MASDDERIRGFLDLGDSAPAAKRLNEEVERLLADLEKLNAEFGARGGDTQTFIASQNKIRAEIDATRGAAEKLSGGEGGGGGLDRLTRGLFGLERATSSIVSGTGLGRAAGILEGVIGMVGGPAGIGFAIGLLANTLENVGPKVYAGFQKMWTGVDPEHTAEVKKQLAEVAAAYRSFVEQMEAKAAPGSEQEQGFIQARLARMFNLKTLTGAGGINNAVLSAALRKEVSDMKRSEIDELAAAQKEADRVNQLWAKQQKQRVEHPNEPLYEKAVTAEEQQAANAAVQEIEQRVASRTRDKLLKQATNPDTPEGQTALRQLRTLAQNHPEQFPSGFARRITEILEGVKPAPTAADLRTSQELLEASWEQTGSRSHRERIERQMMRNQQMIDRMEANPDVDWNTPENRDRLNRMLHPAAANHRPPTRHQTPAGSHQPTGPPRPIGREGMFAGTHNRPDLAFHNRDFSNETNQHRQVREAEAAQRKAAVEFADIKRMQQQAIALEQQGLSTHEKTQRTVAGLQSAMDRLWARMKVLDANANNLLRGQQRTQQNDGGNP